LMIKITPAFTGLRSSSAVFSLSACSIQRLQIQVPSGTYLPQHTQQSMSMPSPHTYYIKSAAKYPKVSCKIRLLPLRAPLIYQTENTAVYRPSKDSSRGIIQNIVKLKQPHPRYSLDQFNTGSCQT